jgi:hypothetical protein
VQQSGLVIWSVRSSNTHRRWRAKPRIFTSGSATISRKSNGRSTRPMCMPSTASRRSAVRRSWRTTTRRRTSSTALPTSLATRCSWRARRRWSTSEIIIQCGVHFMAETSKLLNMDKTVLIPMEGRVFAVRLDHRRRCAAAQGTLSGVPVVTYVNTSADVKAETDICCTSSNAVAGVRELRFRHGAVHSRRVSGDECRQADQEEDPDLEGPLRGA